MNFLEVILFLVFVAANAAKGQPRHHHDGSSFTNSIKHKGVAIVSGGNGNVGIILTTQLLLAGYEVVILDLMVGPKNMMIALAQATHVHTELLGSHYRLHDHVHFVRGDIRDAGAIRIAYDSAASKGRLTAVIHLAAVSRVSVCEENPKRCTDINVDGTRTLLATIDALLPQSANSTKPVFVLASSREVYGDTAGEHRATEEDPRKPVNTYGRSKAGAEDVLRELRASSKGFSNFVIFRFASVFGGIYDIAERLIPAIVRRFFARDTMHLIGGEQVLDFVHVDDVAQLIIRAIHTSTTTDKAQVPVYNLGSGQSRSIADILSVVSKLTKLHLPPIISLHTEALYPTQFRCTVVKLLQTFNYTLQYPTLETGMQQYILSLLNHDVRLLHSRIQTECNSECCEGIRQLDSCKILLHEYPVTAFKALLYVGDNEPFRTEPQAFYSMYLERIGDGSSAMTEDPRLAEYASSNKYQMAEFVMRNGGQGKAISSPVTLVYNSALHAFALLRYAQDGSIAQLKYDGSLKALTSTSEQVFEYGVFPITCNGTTRLPFLKRSPGVYQMRGFRETEEAQQLWHTYGLECHRLLQSSEYLKQFRDRIAAIDLNNPALANTKALGLKDVISQGVKSNQLNFKTFFDKPVCDYDCSLMTVCMATKFCRCVIPVICLNTAHTMNVLSFNPATAPADADIAQREGNTMADKVNAIPWASVLHVSPDKLEQFADQYPLKLHVWEPTGEWAVQLQTLKPPSAEQLDADYLLWATSRNASVPLDEADYILIPYLNKRSTLSASALVSITRAPDLQKRKNSARFVFVLPNDYGACIGESTLDAFDYNGNSTVNAQAAAMIDAYVLQPMGDYNTNCIVPEKDVVIAPVTPMTSELRATFDDLNTVIPSSRRKNLVFFQGAIHGYGRYLRDQVDNKDLFPHTWMNRTFIRSGLHSDGVSPLSYMRMLKNSQFCLLLRGTTGWTFRTSDVIYSGCIPVFLVDMALPYYHEIINYSSFSVLIEERHVEKLEETLLGITDEVMDIMQLRLLKVRKAFLYEIDNTNSDFTHRDDAYAFGLFSLLFKLNKDYFQNLL